MESTNSWKKCSVCKKDIGFGATYYECSVSTCRGNRTGLVFCSVPCWEVHLPGARHKDAAAWETKAPLAPPKAAESSGQRRIIATPPSHPTSISASTSSAGTGNQHEILIVASKLKKYIADQSGMNTSASVMNVLSDEVRRAADRAIENARKEGRKTVLDRDF